MVKHSSEVGTVGGGHQLLPGERCQVRIQVTLQHAAQQTTHTYQAYKSDSLTLNPFLCHFNTYSIQYLLHNY